MNSEVYEQMSEVEDRHWWFRARRAVARHVIRRLNIPKPATILEAGMGCGGNFSMRSEFGAVHGFEPWVPALEMAKKKTGAEIRSGSLPDDVPDWQGRRFHLIVCFDVLEHIEDDAESVRTLSRLLHPEGYLLCTVPALQSLWSYHDESHAHKRRYSRRTLREVFAVNHLELERMSYTNFSLLPLIYTVRTMNTWLHRKGTELRVPGALLNSAFYTITSSERFLIGSVGLPIGSSLLAVARKCR